jgi:CRP-like cAMP-binding protein
MPERPQRCLLCEARLHNPVCQMSPSAVGRLAPKTLVSSFRPGQLLFGQGDPAAAIYIVRSGRVKLVHEHRDGTSQILRVAGPGDLLGAANRAEGAQPVSAVARTSGSVCILRTVELEQLLREDAEFALAWAHLLSDEVQRARESVFRHGPWPAAIRAARYIAKNAAPTPESPLPSLDVTHADMAGLLSIAPETATRLLRELEEDGVIRLSRGRIVVLDADRLQALAGWTGTGYGEEEGG